MTRTHAGEGHTTFTGGEVEYADILIERCFIENEGRLFFKPCGAARQMRSAVMRILDEVWRPHSIEPHRWKLLIRLRVNALHHQGVLTFGEGSNVVFFEGHRMEKRVEVADSRRRSHGKPMAHRDARRNFHKRSIRPAPVY